MSTSSEILFEKLEKLHKKKTGFGFNVTRHYGEGDHLYNYGEIPRGIFYIKSGSVKITRIGSNGRELILRVAQSHDFVGYLSLLKAWSYKTTAICLEASEIYFISKPIFLKAIQTDNDFAYGVIKLICDRYLDTTDDMVDLASKTVKQRICAALLTLDKAKAKKNGNIGVVKIKRKDLGSMVGTIPETVSRQLAELEKEGLIKTSEKSIEIINRHSLATISKLGD